MWVPPPPRAPPAPSTLPCTCGHASSGCWAALPRPALGMSFKFSFLQSTHTYQCRRVPGPLVGTERQGCALFHSNAQVLRDVQGREWSWQGPRRCSVIVGAECSSRVGRQCRLVSGRDPDGISWKKQRPRGAVSWAAGVVRRTPADTHPTPQPPRALPLAAFSPFPVTPALS